MLEVEMIEHDDDDCRYRYTMVVIHNGKVIAEETDGGEPEDNSFMRDWNFVPFLIERAYKLGVADGSVKVIDNDPPIRLGIPKHMRMWEDD